MNQPIMKPYAMQTLQNYSIRVDFTKTSTVL